MGLTIRASKASEVPLQELVQSSYSHLFQVAEALNATSDELSSAVATLEAAIGQLNLGVSAWTELAGGQDEEGDTWWRRSVGYTKIKDKWRIALCMESGSHQFDEHSSDVWPFSDAPRWLRADGAAKLPALFKDLAEAAEKTRILLSSRIAIVKEVSAIVTTEHARLKPAKAGK